MRTFLSLFLLHLVIGVIPSRAQSSAREIDQAFYKADPQISILIHHLPDRWTFRAGDGIFLISAPDSAWVLESASADLRALGRPAREEIIRRDGQKILPQVVLGYEPKWSADKLQLAKIANAAIDDEIRKLPEKYKLIGLKDTVLSSKFRIVYTPRNEKDAKRLRQYEEELSKLTAEKTHTPDFHSGNYSLSIREVVGASDETHWVAPASASLEVYTVLSTLREICGK